jgi:hypothetical protein
VNKTDRDDLKRVNLQDFNANFKFLKDSETLRKSVSVD